MARLARRSRPGPLTRLALVARFFGERFPYVQTVEDAYLLLDIAAHEEQGCPMTVKAILHSGIGSYATLPRRIRRLERLGVVVRRRGARDGRVREAILHASARKALTQFAQSVFGASRLDLHG